MTTVPATPLICLAGPTASGKSAMARAIAQAWPTEIINVDSATIYRTMDIGTAKPDLKERAQYSHHLLDILDPTESYSAAAFRKDALNCVTDIRARGKLPILVGGTMLYFKALREGLNDLPKANLDIRRELDAQALKFGWPYMHAKLALVDPQTASRLAPNDSQRIGRALEIQMISGRPMSALIGNVQRNDTAVPTLTISLEPTQRSLLHEKIAWRFDQMLEAGLLDEVKALRARGDLHLDLPSIRCVGYRQLWKALDGEMSIEQAREQAIAATRQLAKRQLTWLRGMPERRTVNCFSESAIDNVLEIVSDHLAQNRSPH